MNNKVLHFLLIITMLINGINTCVVAQNQLLPAPQHLSYSTGKFQLRNAAIYFAKGTPGKEQHLITRFATLIKAKTGLSLTVSDTQSKAHRYFVFAIEHSASALPLPGEKVGKGSREAYRIKVTSAKVLITAISDAGLFYALQTLQQLVEKDGKNSFIPEVEIEDYPDFAYRGVMMDFSHGGLLTEDEIKSQIDFLAGWKMNQYYFYSEANIELKGYPLVNYHAQYSQEQIKRIIAYAKDRFVDVIPFVELYGHLHDLLRLEKYAHLAIGSYGHELDPRNPGTQILLREWMTQYVSLFSSPFIHIGFDETWETERLSLIDSSINPKQLYLNQLMLVFKILQENKKSVMVWTDVSKNYPDIISSFPRNIIPVVWEYSSDPVKLSNWIEPVLKEQMPFFIQSAVDGWGHIYPSGYSFENIDLCLKTAKEKKASGYITSVWTDAVQSSTRNSWLFIAYGCIGAWQKNSLDREQFTVGYSKIMYPAIAASMNDGFKKMAVSQSALEKCLGNNSRHTILEMWSNPFSVYFLKNTNEHVDDFKRARMAAEEAQEALVAALRSAVVEDTGFIKTLLVNCRLLHYTATRYLWAKTIVDRWNLTLKVNDKNSDTVRKANDYLWTMFYDLNYTAHGLISDMLDQSTEIKIEYRQSWLSEYMPYRLENMSGRFDAEYIFWKDLDVKIQDYERHKNKDELHGSFQDIFKMN